MGDLHQIKQRHLAVQAALCAEAEAPMFDHPAWDAAETVVDVGCGEGSYLRHLAARFPGKRFVGVDVHETAIALAEAGPPLANLRFRWGRVEDLAERFDVLVSRFCLLYVDDLDAIAAWAADHVGGGVLEIDNADDLFAAAPAVAPLTGLLHATRLPAAEGRVRTALLDAAPTWARHGFEVDAQREVVLHSGDGDAELFRELLGLSVAVSIRRPLPEELAERLAAWQPARDRVRIGIRGTWFRPAGARPDGPVPAADERRASAAGRGGRGRSPASDHW